MCATLVGIERAIDALISYLSHRRSSSVVRVHDRPARTRKGHAGRAISANEPKIPLADLAAALAKFNLDTLAFDAPPSVSRTARLAAGLDHARCRPGTIRDLNALR
jgi:hypothetical protein